MKPWNSILFLAFLCLIAVCHWSFSHGDFFLLILSVLAFVALSTSVWLLHDEARRKRAALVKVKESLDQMVEEGKMARDVADVYYTRVIVPAIENKLKFSDFLKF
jgi:hypothetical protein